MIQEENKKVKFLKSNSLKKQEDKKISNKKLYGYVSNVDDISMTSKTKDRIQDCGTFLEFYSDVTLENIKLHSGNFCGNRFCPICSANKSRKDSYILKLMVDYLSTQYKFVFMTLTVKNCLANDLDETIKFMNKSFKKFREILDFKTAFKGYLRKLEVTYNPIRDDFHPHFHLLLAVKPSYFHDTKLYMSHDRVLELWQRSCRDDSITQVDIRKYRDGETKSIFEITKYMAKDSQYLYSKDVFKVFYKALKGKNLLTYNGVFKEALTLYNEGKLDYLREVNDIDYFYKIYSLWTKQGYNFNKIIELTEEEKSIYKDELLD